eukprot:1499076-Alexandrium_andersonii.AAC.1
MCIRDRFKTPLAATNNHAYDFLTAVVHLVAAVKGLQAQRVTVSVVEPCPSYAYGSGDGGHGVMDV